MLSFNNTKTTELIEACKGKKSLNVILNILSRSDPGEVDDNDITALIWACYYSLEDIALAIIATGKHNPGQVTNNGNTALKFACSTNLKNVVPLLLDSGISKPEQINNYGVRH